MVVGVLFGIGGRLLGYRYKEIEARVETLGVVEPPTVWEPGLFARNPSMS